MRGQCCIKMIFGNTFFLKLLYGWIYGLFELLLDLTPLQQHGVIYFHFSGDLEVLASILKEGADKNSN